MTKPAKKLSIKFYIAAAYMVLSLIVCVTAHTIGGWLFGFAFMIIFWSSMTEEWMRVYDNDHST